MLAVLGYGADTPCSVYATVFDRLLLAFPTANNQNLHPTYSERNS